MKPVKGIIAKVTVVAFVGLGCERRSRIEGERRRWGNGEAGEMDDEAGLGRRLGGPKVWKRIY